MNMISSFPLYSGRCHIVPDGTEAMGCEDVAEISDAAVEAGPASETFGDQRRNRAMRQRCAEVTIVNRHSILTPYRHPILTPFVLSRPGAA
jgi:hypothetical protein